MRRSVSCVHHHVSQGCDAAGLIVTWTSFAETKASLGLSLKATLTISTSTFPSTPHNQCPSQLHLADGWASRSGLRRYQSNCATIAVARGQFSSWQTYLTVVACCREPLALGLAGLCYFIIYMQAEKRNVGLIVRSTATAISSNCYSR